MNREPIVFIVDDDPAFSESMAVLLSSMGLKSQCFSSGIDYLEQFDPEAPGVLLLDVRMPSISGLSLQERLAKEPLCLPIIILTGHADVPTAIRAMQRGAAGFFQKMSSETELCDAIQKAIADDGHNRSRYTRRQEIAARLARLTPAENQVLELVLEGRPNKTIASKLGVSRRAVEDRGSARGSCRNSKSNLFRNSCAWRRMPACARKCSFSCGSRTGRLRLPVAHSRRFPARGNAHLIRGLRTSGRRTSWANLGSFERGSRISGARTFERIVEQCDIVPTGPTIFVIDDDPALIRSVNGLGQSMGLSVEAFDSGEQFFRQFDADRPGCLILDACLLDGFGLEIQQRLVKMAISPPIIFVAGETDVATVVRAKQSGAINFLLKQGLSETELWESIRNAIERDGANRAIHLRHQAQLGYLSRLTAPERHVLDLLLAGKSNRHIAEQLGVTRRAAESRRARLMRKLCVASLPELVRFCIDVGLYTPGNASTD